MKPSGHYSGHKPARSVVVVKRLHFGFQVGIEATPCCFADVVKKDTKLQDPRPNQRIYPNSLVGNDTYPMRLCRIHPFLDVQ